MLTHYSLNNRNSRFKDAIHFLLGKRLLKYAHIHATSEQERRDVLQTCRANGITVIPNLVCFPIAQQAATTSNDHYRLLFLSRIEEKKGLELLFEALATITIPYQLSIAGSGDENYIRSLKLLVQQLNIQDYVHWLGHVQNDAKFELIAQNDLVVLTSYNENFANVVVESLAMGTPVLISEAVGLADYVIKNELGWVTTLEIEAITSAIINSFTAAVKRRHIRKIAPKMIQGDFDHHQLIAQYQKMYATV